MVVDADRAGRLLGGDTVRRLPGTPRDLPQHPQPATDPPGRGGGAREGRLQRAPSALATIGSPRAGTCGRCSPPCASGATSTRLRRVLRSMTHICCGRSSSRCRPARRAASRRGRGTFGPCGAGCRRAVAPGVGSACHDRVARGHRRPFSEVSAVVAQRHGDVRRPGGPSWTIGGRPNGGYLLAILGRAAAIGRAPTTTSSPPAPTTCGLPNPGRWSITTNVLRDGRSASQVRAGMGQGGTDVRRGAPHVVGARPTPRRPTGTAVCPPKIETPYEECFPLAPQLPSGTRVAIMEQIEVRLEPAASGFTQGPAEWQRANSAGWLALPRGEEFDRRRFCSPSTPFRPPPSTSSWRVGSPP